MQQYMHYQTIAESSESQKMQLENQLSQEISELKKAQDALSKAIQRSPVTAKINKDSVMTAPSPVKLSDMEFNTLITEVKNESVDDHDSVEKN